MVGRIASTATAFHAPGELFVRLAPDRLDDRIEQGRPGRQGRPGTDEEDVRARVSSLVAIADQVDQHRQLVRHRCLSTLRTKCAEAWIPYPQEWKARTAGSDSHL